MICYLSRNYKDTDSAGNKAKTDIEKTLAAMGCRNVGLPMSVSANPVTHFLLTLASVLKAPLCLHRGDILVVQYPLKKYFTAVCRAAHARGARVVTVIHDLGSFRRKALTPGQEMKRLGHSDYIIAHNDSMKQWLESRGCRVPVGTLKIFDFLSSRQARPRSTAGSPYTVVYAGALNIRKNRFLYEWGALADNYDISIYGNGFEPEQAKRPEKFRMMGFVPSDKLISTASGDFGLVWDGASTEACTGDWGEYLKINAPHKTSLYLRCLLPVIIWDKAAMAPFVRDNGVGICISSLSQLGEALAAITPEKYARMLDNVRTVSSNLADGYYIKTAVREGADKLNRNI